ncbi:MAG: DNA polymerase III subunit beta [Candidatus Nomurabacteria bacterium]|jgi:DNA polymerase-3 subunit beta|nr:DNA polymerase III subunit beta [Candidatus Nomurabacteria bacterium]
MKIILNQDGFSKALNSVARIANSHSTLPILNNILLRAENGVLQLNATNLEVFINNSITAKVEEDGVVLVPANLITDFINNLPKTKITLKTKDGKLKIEAGNYKSTINTISTDEFPAFPDDKLKTGFELDSELFKTSAGQVLPATSNDTTRPILTGLYLHTFNDKLYLTATDGYRLAEKQLIDKKTDINTIIPATTISEVVRVIESDQAIKVSLNDEQIKFEIGQITIISRLIDGNFINYRSLIPEKTDNSAEVDRSEFVQAVKVAELFARQSAESIILKTSSANKTLEINTITSEFGDNNSEIEAEIVGDASITLNAKYLLTALNAITGEKIKFSFSGKLAPALLTGQDDSYKHIIMPVKS